MLCLARDLQEYNIGIYIFFVVDIILNLIHNTLRKDCCEYHLVYNNTSRAWQTRPGTGTSSIQKGGIRGDRREHHVKGKIAGQDERCDACSVCGNDVFGPI